MRLKQIGSNQTELIFNDGTHVLFSYETPVAVSNLDGVFVTETKYSNTTTRHINKWCDSIIMAYRKRTTVPQDNINTFPITTSLVKRGGKSG